MTLLYFLGGLTIAMSVALLWNFSNIVRFGSHLIQEPHPVILWTEIVGLIVILFIGILACIQAGKQMGKVNEKHTVEEMKDER